MTSLTENAIRCTLFLSVVLSIQLSFAQSIVTGNDFEAVIKSSLTITDGKLLIDLRDSSEFNNLNLAISTDDSTTDHNENESNTIISANLSATTIPSLTTNVSVKMMRSIWTIQENSNITSININYLEDPTSQSTLLGSYFMFISKTGKFDSKSDYKIMYPDGNGNLQTDYNFGNSTYITFGYARHIISERSIYFDGTDDFIDMDDNLNLNPSSFTVSAWVKRDPKTSGTVSILSKRDEDFNHGYDFRILNTNRIEIIWKNESDQSVISNTKIPNNEWHHVAASYNGSEISIYIDGVRDKVESKTMPVSTHDSFRIGAAGTDTPRQYFKGNIDEVRVWDIALSADQLRFIMNQEINENAGLVMGKILPNSITKNDISEIPWSKLAGYYPMSKFMYTNTSDASGNEIHGALKNISTVDRQTAPLPYQSTQKGNWDEKTTWINGNVQYIPGSASVVDSNRTVDWNIVKTSHLVTLDNSTLPIKNKANRKVLGLYVDANELVVIGQTSINEGNGLTISHYLSLTGKIDLEGESQLIQELNCDLDVAPNGVLERDQQGPSDVFTYKYWSSPVGESDINKNDFSYAVKDVMYDGEQPINFITSGYDGAPTNPIAIADYWIWKYANQTNNNYSSWQHIKRNGTVYAGEGFTMKGPGTGSILHDQNYVFRGKPNNGDINLTIHAGNDYLVGNPYASAIDANQFIIDNGISNSESSPTISGTLYFWKHWGGGSHYLNNYQGGYATYNFSGGVAAASYGTNDPFVATGGIPTQIPRRTIPVGQGFFVVGKNTGTINFNNGQRVFQKEKQTASSILAYNDTSQNQPNYSSEESDDRMKFRLGFKSINTIHRQLLLTIDENASATVDWAYDAKRIESQMDDMYWIINEDTYVIQASDKAELSTIFPIGIKTNSDGINTITIDDLENTPNDLNIYIHDIDLDLYHDLRETDYNVYLNTGQYDNRFEITFSTKDDLLGVDAPINNGIDILYSNQSKKLILINPKLVDIKSVELFNMLGQSIYSNRDILESDYSEYDIKNLNTGTYVIKLSTRNGSLVTKKVLVR